MAKSVTQDGAATIGAGDSVTPPPSTSVDIKSMSDEDFAAYEAGRKKYGELAAKSKAEAGKKSEAQFVKDYGSYLYSKPMEEFKPSQETAAGFAALGSLMMVAGSLFGGSGRLAGIGAMNNIAGMVKGYQQGRKDLYEQERQQFEENMKVQERNRADIKEAFNLALKMAPTDLRGAEEFMGKVFMSKGMNIPHEMMKTSGLTHTASVVLGAADKADQISKQVSAQIGSPTTPAGLPPIGAKLTPQQEIQFAQETARRAARAKDEKGAQEWVSVDGKTDRMTRQEVDAARKNFVTAVLRKESGAAISPSEFYTESQKYFPQPGDEPAVIAQKRHARDTAIKAMEIQAGPGKRHIEETNINTGAKKVVNFNDLP